jgi:hypothetical protein
MIYAKIERIATKSDVCIARPESETLTTFW